MQSQSIMRGSPEWNYSQFRLQLILSHPNIDILSIQKNSGVQNFFESKQNFFKIDAAIDVTQEKQNYIQSLRNNMKKGSIFRCGRVQQQPRLEDGFGNPKIYRMIFFKIAVKNMLPIYQSQSITNNDLLNYLQDYDSIYLSSKKEQITVYDHRYFLKSTSQYIWEYDIEYRYLNPNDPVSKVRNWVPQNQKCQTCMTNKSYWYCIEEKQTFCKDCYDQQHHGKFRKSHKKQFISPFNCYKKCLKPTHNQNPLEFYCFNCKSLKCQKCLSDPNHNFNRNFTPMTILPSDDSFIKRSTKQTHEYVQIRNLVKIFQQKQRQINSSFKQKLIEKIKQVQTIVSFRKSEYQQKLRQLEQNLTQSILKLKKSARIQINEAVTLQIELKRKFDEILWIEKFVSHNENSIDAESNLQLKQLFTQYVTYINAEQYFKKIQQKIGIMKMKI